MWIAPPACLQEAGPGPETGPCLLHPLACLPMLGLVPPVWTGSVPPGAELWLLRPTSGPPCWGLVSACFPASDLLSVFGGDLNAPLSGSMWKPMYLEVSSSVVEKLPAVQEMWVQSLGREDPLEKGMAAHPVFFWGNLMDWRGSSPWGHKESRHEGSHGGMAEATERAQPLPHLAWQLALPIFIKHVFHSVYGLSFTGFRADFSCTLEAPVFILDVQWIHSPEKRSLTYCVSSSKVPIVTGF